MQKVKRGKPVRFHGRNGAEWGDNGGKVRPVRWVMLKPYFDPKVMPVLAKDASSSTTPPLPFPPSLLWYARIFSNFGLGCCIFRSHGCGDSAGERLFPRLYELV